MAKADLFNPLCRIHFGSVSLHLSMMPVMPVMPVFSGSVLLNGAVRKCAQTKS
jgi:hypothetical protein